jgi:hypothetical protein
MTIDIPHAATGKRVLAHECGPVYEGTGRIHVRIGAIEQGIDSALWEACKLLVDDTQTSILIYSGDTGRHVPHSRHLSGCAVDISMVGARSSVWMPATLRNRYCMALVHCLRTAGWQIGEKRGQPGLLLGPVYSGLNPSGIAHDRHLHVSIAEPAFQAG